MIGQTAPTASPQGTHGASATPQGASERSEAGPAAGSPWYIANTVTPPRHGDHCLWRAERFKRRRVSSALLVDRERDKLNAADGEWVRPPRLARCSWRVGTEVGVHMGASGAHFSGTERCGSIWSCPVCAAVIRADRAKEIEEGVTRHLAAGGGALFITGTIRHTAADSLATGLEAVLEGWRRCIRGNPWKREAERIGVVGVIRSVEVTRGWRNGWHPHLHGIILLERPITKHSRQAFDSWMSDRWGVMVKKLGAGLPSAARGFTVQNVDGDGRVLSKYLAKLQEEEKKVGIGAEVARADLKTARGGSRVPFQILDSAGWHEGDRELWFEYIDATAGRRCFTWSKGLRKALKLEEEKTDEQIIADSERGEMLGVIDAKTYDLLRTSAQLADLLEQVEIAAAGGETGYLLGLVTPKRDKGIDVDPAQRLPEVLRSNCGLPMDTRRARVRAVHAPRSELQEVGERHPVLAPVLIGSRDLLDVGKSRSRAAGESVAPVVAVPQFDWDAFEAAQRRELAAIHEKIGVKES